MVDAGDNILTTDAHERLVRGEVRPFTVRPDHLVMFTRYPAPGATKTRLIPALGSEGAARLHREMTAHTLHTVEQLRFVGDMSAEVRVVGASLESMAACFGKASCYASQGEGDLGARMHRAIGDGFARGAERVIVIGADCPSLDAATLNEAFDALCSHDLVIGPAADGGYYLIGLRRPCARLFEDVDWGTEHVRATTLQRAAEANLSVRQLATKRDVDLPGDLPEWERHRRPRISVIIPAINEAAQLHDAMASVRAADGVELIIVDGGSTDDTTKIAEGRGARVIRSAPGRAIQMNAGAAQARGKFLLFLHADTRLPAGYAEQIEHLLARPHTILAAFRLGIQHRRFVFRLTELAANLRSRWLGMPYGDQALAIGATDFYRLNGFREISIMEDYDLVRRAKRAGRIGLARSRVQTSARRWLKTGWFRLTFIHQVCVIGYRLGVSPKRIASWRGDDLGKRVAARPIHTDCIDETTASSENGGATDPSEIRRQRERDLAIHNELKQVPLRK